MDMSLILLILGFVVVTFLIFKFIKKVVVAIFSFVFLILIIVASVFGLVYLDYNYLASQNDFNVNVIYGSSQDANFGTIIPVENKTPDISKISSYDISNLQNLDLSSVEPDFYFFVDKDLFNSLLNNKSSYYLMGTENLSFSGVNIRTQLTKTQVLDVINSKNSLDDYVNILNNLNNAPEVLGVSMKPLIKKELKTKLDEVHLTLNEALFMSVLKDSISSSGSQINLIKGFKDEKLEVYPDRFSFKLIRMLPVDTLISYLPNQLTN